MTIKFGPILNFRGGSDAVWKVGVLLGTDTGTPPALRWDAGGATGSPIATPLESFANSGTGLSLWRFDCDIPRGAQQVTATYAVNGVNWDFAVPSRDSAPAMAYASCNGFSALKLMKSTKVPNALWEKLNAKHAQSPFHLLLLGGDQLYFDSMWEEIQELQDWAALPTAQGVKQQPSQKMKDLLRDYYRGLYPKRWSQAAPARAFATIPTLMMWDDHDIFDGWGSYPENLQNCAVYQEIFRHARDNFALYQQQNAPGTRHPLALPGQEYFSFGCRIGSVAILAPDMRSERSESQVLGAKSWKAIFDWLEALPTSDAPAGGVRHLFVMSSIPVVYPDFSMLEGMLGFFPGRQELEDDLKDHWMSLPHRQERLRLIHRLLDFAARKKCRVTLLSGDVHVGAVGVVQSGRYGTDHPSSQVITQLTSSGIVHPAPPGMVLFFLENVVGKSMCDDRDINSEIVQIPGTQHHFIGARNFLALLPDAEDRYWANWHLEAEPHPYTKTIHPVGFRMGAAKLPEQ